MVSNKITSLINCFKKKHILYDHTNYNNIIRNKDNNYSAYLGIDPTAPDLHIGNLFQILNLIRTSEFGLKPIFLIGGGTALIGDPSGKNDIRPNLELEKVNDNKSKIKQKLINILTNYKYNYNKNFEYKIIDNIDFYKDLDIITFTNKVLSKFRVSPLLSQTHFKTRLETTGLSLSEFIYPIFQSYDFYCLNKKYNTIVQLGGSDQWANIVSGIELINKNNEESQAIGITTKLLLDKNGNKFGKSEKEKIWITDYDGNNSYIEECHNFILNLEDIYLPQFLNYFTFEEDNIIEDILNKHNENPSKRYAHMKLSEYILKLLTTNIDLIENKKYYKELIDIHDMQYFFDKGEDYFLAIIEKALNNDIIIIEKNQNIKIEKIIYECYDNKHSHKELKKMLNMGSFLVNSYKINSETDILSDNNIQLLFGKYCIIKKSKKDPKIIKFVN